MDIGGKIVLLIENQEQEFVCVDKHPCTDYEGLPDVECVFALTDDPSTLRYLPEWLADSI